MDHTELSRTPPHWFGHRLAAVDVETTGLDPMYHEIVQLAILPLDGDIRPLKGVMPFQIFIKPEFPERINKDAMRVNNITIEKLLTVGVDRDTAIDQLITWKKKLGLGHTQGGFERRLMPLAHNWPFDYSFLTALLGPTQFGEIFHPHYRDTLCVTEHVNDDDIYHGVRPQPYRHLKLTQLCTDLGIEYKNQHDALGDCVAVAELYRRILARKV